MELVLTAPQPSRLDTILASARPQSGDERAAIAAAADARIGTPEQLARAVDGYQQRFGNVIGVDNALALFPEYNADADSQARNVSAVMPAASRLTAAVVEASLRDCAQSHVDGDYTVLTAGGAGAGKSSALEDVHPGGRGWIAPNDAGPRLIFDQTLASYNGAEAKVKAARDAGLDVVVAYVHRGLEASATSVVQRAIESGRTLPASAIASLHVSARETIEKLAAAHADDAHVHVHVIDNTGPRGSAHEMSLADLAHAEKPTREQAVERVTAAVTRALSDAPTVSSAIVEGLLLTPDSSPRATKG